MNNVFTQIQEDLETQGYKFERVDYNRPWGGFWVIDETQTEKFIRQYFPDHEIESLTLKQKVSPKILLVAPQKRLSWQYHNRRSEVWRVIKGTVGVVKSDTDEETELQKYREGELIVLKKGERHRLVGLDQWGTVAEIWQHTDPELASDEDDIIRLQDDFDRKSPV